MRSSVAPIVIPGVPSRARCGRRKVGRFVQDARGQWRQVGRNCDRKMSRRSARVISHRERGEEIMVQAENDRRIDYIELGVADVERAKAFYGKAFDWTFTDYGPAYCEFSDGRLSGGFTTMTPPRPGGPLVILYAVDLVAAQARVEAAGGRIAKPIFDFPGGQRFHFLDPDGYELAVWTKR